MVLTKQCVDPIQERLKEEVKAIEPKPSEVARQTGLNYNTVYQIQEGELKKSLRADTLSAFVKAYPQIDVVYVLTGERRQKDKVEVAAEQARDLLTEALKP